MINKIKSISTAHITPYDGKLMREDKEDLFAQINGGYGSIFYVAEDNDELEEQKIELKEKGYSIAFFELFELANNEGCSYLCIESGVPEDGSLPKFNW
jgi:hypothetical protein